jgi:uncharacterized damage-inducible protein DinB
MKKERRFVKAIEEQFRRAFGMWKEEIGNIPAKEWRRGEIDYLVPARHLCHLIVTADYYLGRKSPEEYDWNCYFGGDWEELKTSRLPRKSDALKKLSEFEEVMMSRFAALTDEDLWKKETQSPWTGKTLAGKLLYLLRHSQHHVGEMHAELRHRGIKRARWR